MPLPIFLEVIALTVILVMVVQNLPLTTGLATEQVAQAMLVQEVMAVVPLQMAVYRMEMVLNPVLQVETILIRMVHLLSVVWVEQLLR